MGSEERTGFCPYLKGLEFLGQTSQALDCRRGVLAICQETKRTQDVYQELPINTR